MPYQKHHTTTEDLSQGSDSQDDWTKEVLPRLPATLEEQAMKLKAFERSRKIGSATDLLVRPAGAENGGGMSGTAGGIAGGAGCDTV